MLLTVVTYRSNSRKISAIQRVSGNLADEALSLPTE
jgi:hypothetical protein